ncbi:uncharacterized mitochondrial protein AtMg00810-like [Lycium ferocissimum]|uniref:uncharacterized mitochondrial protein AtMg00810-like n=1 Tax=Lycium ferocissimum TaxID=112874 RepID=UPI0028169464|nr:uncharacterized mitochondrial protein AtMg00810-like [Lycium ferocissimum]
MASNKLASLVPSLSPFLIQSGFHSIKIASSSSFSRQGDLKFYILVYVDDILLTCSDPSKLDCFIGSIKKVFPVKDLGALHYFLGIEVKPHTEGFLLTQQKYVEDFLTETKMQTSKPCSTPMVISPNLSKFMGSPLANPEQYRKVVGAL